MVGCAMGVILAAWLLYWGDYQSYEWAVGATFGAISLVLSMFLSGFVLRRRP